MSRLAWLSGTTVSKICKLPVPFGEGGTGTVGKTSRFCGPGDTYRQRIRSLELLTGVDTIRCGSFFVLDRLLSTGAAGRFLTGHRWCPICYSEWSDESSWEPLIWRIDLIHVCPLHGCRLMGICPRCHTLPADTPAYAKRRECRSCGKSLGGPGRRTKRSVHDIWIEQQVCELVKFCSTPQQDEVGADVFRVFTEGLAQVALNVDAMPAPLVAAIDRLNDPATGDRTTLRTLVNLCALQGISIVDVLNDPRFAASRPLLDHWRDYSSIDFQDDERHSKKISAFRICLSRILGQSEGMYLPSIAVLLKAIGLNQDLALERSVDLYQSYKIARLRQGPYSTLIHTDRAFAAAMACIRDLTGKRLSARGPSAAFVTRIARIANIRGAEAREACQAAWVCGSALWDAKAILRQQS